MEQGDWTGRLQEILNQCSGPGFAFDSGQFLPDVTTYLVPSFDHDALLFSVPALFLRQPAEEIPLAPAGSDGAVHAVIERIKQKSRQVPALAPLHGAGTQFPGRYDATAEPYTVIHSPGAIGVHLWHPDDRNFCDQKGVHLLVRGALPCPASCSPAGVRQVSAAIRSLLEGISEVVEAIPARVLEDGWALSLDQKLLRERLPALGLVAFVGDGSCPARSFSRHRSFFRIAGRKDGVNVPFACPQELSPVEIDLPATNERITGLGIRQREVFAVTGSNAQGKTTFLAGIIAGMDDHGAGDGRERIVTVRGIRTAEAMTCGLSGADVSMFFSALPPGIGGTVRAAYGMGSGSMTMASQVQEAFAGKAPVLVIDEDRAAPNLLVKSCLQTEEVTPLAELLAKDRQKTGDTALIFAACAMDTLIAQADRIMVLDRHAAKAIDRAAFIAMLKDALKRTADDLA